LVSGVYLNFLLEDAIPRIAAAGFDTIDVWSGRPHVYRRDYCREALEGLRSQIEGCGLQVSSFLPAFHRYPYSLSSPVEAIRSDSLQYMRECADNAAALSAPLLLIVPGRVVHGQSREDGWLRLAESIEVTREYCRQYPLQLGIECVNHSELINSAAAARKMIEELGDERLGMVLDTGHVNLVPESIEDAVRCAGRHLRHVHVNDNDGMRQQNLIPGDGTFDFRRLTSALREVGYDGVITAELDYQYTSDPDKAATVTARRVRTMFDRCP
jgi:sugar phosphate isomerase/epimerase